MRIKKFNQLNENHNEQKHMFLVGWDMGTGEQLSVYTEEFIDSMLDEFFEGNQEAWDLVKNSGVNKRFTEGDLRKEFGDQVTNGYIEWIEKVPLN